MLALSTTISYRKSIRRLARSGVFDQAALDAVIDILASEKTLPVRCRDHQLKGVLREYRECHIKGDLLLVYKIEKEALVLLLAEIGSHSYLDF